jgi:hypothetical protein
MVNKIKGFEKGEIKKDDISVVLARLAPLTAEISKLIDEGLALNNKHE